MEERRTHYSRITSSIGLSAEYLEAVGLTCSRSRSTEYEVKTKFESSRVFNWVASMSDFNCADTFGAVNSFKASVSLWGLSAGEFCLSNSNLKALISCLFR